MNYQRNKKYFTPSVLLKIVGVLLLVFSLPQFVSYSELADSRYGADEAPMVLMLGLVFAVVGVVLLYVAAKGSPSDEEIDAAVANELQTVRDRALAKLNLDEEEVQEIEPLFFHSYDYNKTLIKRGKDQRYRSSKYEAVMFFFAENDLHCYTYQFSLVEDWKREATDVYFYKDLVSMATQTEYITLPGLRFDYEYFKLTTTGGTTISCNIHAAEAQRSINAMRQLILAKKRS